MAKILQSFSHSYLVKATASQTKKFVLLLNQGDREGHGQPCYIYPPQICQSNWTLIGQCINIWNRNQKQQSL